MVSEGRKITQHKVSDEVLKPDAFEDLIIIDMEELPDVEEHFGRVDYEYLADLFDGFIIFFVDEFMVIFTSYVFFFEIHRLLKFVVVWF